MLLIAAASAGVIWQKEQLHVIALSRIDPLPETRAMVAEKRYAEAADYLGFFMDYEYVSQNPESQLLYRDISKKRESWRYQANKLVEGLLFGTSDEVIGKSTGIATDFLVLGDIRDLVNQGVKHFKGEDTDNVLVALASLGVIASGAQIASGAGTVATGGAAAPTVVGTTSAKGGLAALKVVRKIGKMPSWLSETIVESAKIIKETKKLGALSSILSDVRTLAKTRGGCELLSKTKDATSLKRMATFAETFGSNSATLYRIGGDLAVDIAQESRKTGKDIIELAATFGQDGLRTLDKVGAINFVKYSTRASKMAYKGELLHLLARLLMIVPTWILYVIVAFGGVIWLPWHGLYCIMNRLRGGAIQKH